MEIKKVGVVGCGQMGGGIAQICAQSGYQTVVSEVNNELLAKGMEAIKSSLATGVKRGKMTEADRDATLSRLKGTVKMEDFADCQIVIEAIIENMDLKRKTFASLENICPKSTILASNTSCLSIIEIAMATKRPNQVLGMHFFNPVPLMKLLELVKSITTSEETIQTARSFGTSLGKSVIVAKDMPGFIVNRLLVPYLLDAIRIYEAGAATREDIDQGMMLGCNHPMGPLTLLDLIGLDTIHFIGNSMYEDFKDARFSSPPLLKKMVTAGQLGRKTGKGFYDYK
jgi:3-hydroxybutyryl-CoA dehydrogenase